jgi:nicotinamidase-related amidase
VASAVALLLIDFINDFEFENAERIFPAALAAARAAHALKLRAGEAGVPVVYCNDNFGQWRSDFRALLSHARRDSVRGKPIAELLAPGKDDYFVLKPKHSGFHSTALDILLAYLGVRTLVLTGVAGDSCVLFTAHDAYVRDYRLVVASDCVASESPDANRWALRHLADVCKADVLPSSAVDFASLGHRPG